MALNTMKYSLSQVTKRGLAAQAAARPAEQPPSPEVTCTALPNKLMVSSLDLCGPLSRVSIVFRVGPRQETPRNMGIVHLIRAMAGFGTQKCTGFSLWKNIQHSGGHIYCTGDREITGFHLVSARHKINDSLKFLAALTSAPAFKSWEVRDNMNRLNYEIGGLSPQTKVIDNLHAAAFRTGLGNSLFIAPDRIGTHTPTMCQTFYKEGFTANRATVSGYNMAHKDMLEFAKSLDLYSNELPEGNSTYFGGEIRHHVNSYFAHVAIATQGGGCKDMKEALAYCVLQHAYGAGTLAVWGGSPAPLTKAINDAAPDVGVRCINATYSDTGLFGFMLSGPAENTGKVVKDALKVLKSGSVSEADFKRAKAIVKANLLYSCENSENVIEDMTVQTLLGGLIIPGPVIGQAVDKLTLSDVTTVAKKVASGKLSLSAYGDLTFVPYLDELK